jgi:multisubunit Na+/H+ antiporter MnhG subunit
LKNTIGVVRSIPKKKKYHRGNQKHLITSMVCFLLWNASDYPYGIFVFFGMLLTTPMVFFLLWNASDYPYGSIPKKKTYHRGIQKHSKEEKIP